MKTGELLKSLELRPSKKLGQNFLTDSSIARKIVNCALDGVCGHVLEVGPGLGALTEHIVKSAAASFSIVEKDRRLHKHIVENFGQYLESAEQTDVLDTSLSKPTIVISNLPYVISSEFCFWMAKNRENLVHGTVLFQREFAERLCSKEGSKTYGALSIMAWYYFELELLFCVPGGAFVPAASIESRLVRFVPKVDVCDEEGKVLKELVQTCFQKRRKQLGSVLGQKYGSWLLSSLEDVGYSATSRPEELSPRSFLKLVKIIRQTNQPE